MRCWGIKSRNLSNPNDHPAGRTTDHRGQSLWAQVPAQLLRCQGHRKVPSCATADAIQDRFMQVQPSRQLATVELIRSYNRLFIEMKLAQLNDPPVDEVRFQRQNPVRYWIYKLQTGTRKSRRAKSFRKSGQATLHLCGRKIGDEIGLGVFSTSL